MDAEYHTQFLEKNIEIKTYDIDIAGHVNNLVYIRWIDDLRCELFSGFCSLEKLLRNNYYPVVISTEVKYKKQLKLFDKPIGKIYLESVCHGVIQLHVEISNNNNCVLIATQKCVLVDLTTQKMLKGDVMEFLLSCNFTVNSLASN